MCARFIKFLRVRVAQCRLIFVLYCPIEDILPPAPPKRRRGMPHAPFRKILNTLLYVLITGCRWCDVPRGPQWGSKSATHRWLQRWQANGTLAAMQARILGIAEEQGGLGHITVDTFGNL